MANITHVIHHNQQLLTKFGRILQCVKMMSIWQHNCQKTRGGSRGRVQGVSIPPSWDDLQFSNTTGILQKKETMWFIGVEVEQETSANPPKKNPGSAPENWTVNQKDLGRRLRNCFGSQWGNFWLKNSRNSKETNRWTTSAIWRILFCSPEQPFLS